MVKHVRINDSANIRLNDSDFSALSYIGSRSATPEDWFACSVKGLAEALDVSVATARRALKRLDELGLIKVREQWYRDGGRLENEHAITELGRSVLDADGAEQ